MILTIKQIAAPIRGFVDDYAFMVRALLDLYEITFDSAWIEWAAELQRRQDELFWDQEGGGYWVESYLNLPKGLRKCARQLSQLPFFLVNVRLQMAYYMYVVHTRK